MDLIRGQDVAGDNQRLARMAYPTWAGLGYRFGWVEFVRGELAVPDADAHLAAMHDNGYRAAGYINITHGAAAAQMWRFLDLAPDVDNWWDMLDIEGNLTEADIRAACDVHDQSGRRLALYFRPLEWLAIVPKVLRYRYKQYKIVVATYPFDVPFGHEPPMNTDAIALRTRGPATFAPPVCDPWTVDDVLSHQHTGQGSLPDGKGGLYSFLDLHVLNPNVNLEEPMSPVRIDGCLLGGHTQGNSSITPIYRNFQAAGVVPCIGIADEDGGKMLEWQAIGVPTRIARYQHEEVGDDHDFEGGGGGRAAWSIDKRKRWVTGVVTQPYIRSGNFAQFQATGLFQIWNNEWENQDIDGWMLDLDLWQQVLEQSQQRNAHDKAGLMGISDEQAAQLHPVRYALPIFNYGTPKTWDMYVAIANHPIWPRAAALGWVLAGHEGIAPGQRFDYGENQPPTPGQPFAPGAGLVNMRLYNLLWLLQQRGVRINWAVLEWYDGIFGRDVRIEDRVRNMIRHDLLLASSPFSATCLGYCQYEFTDDPNNRWYKQDCTLLWKHPLWLAHMLRQRGRKNGATNMPDVTQANIDALALNSQAVIAAEQANLHILAQYQTPAGWWAGLPLPFQGLPLTTSLDLYDALGNKTGNRVVNPATYVLDVHQVVNGFFRVTDYQDATKLDLWVKATDTKAR